MSNSIAIGDIHGCAHELRELMEVLDADGFLHADTRLYFVGDYVDRGPDSKAVVEYCRRLSGSRECVFLCGNHDFQFLRHLQSCHEFRPANGEFETIMDYCTGPIAREDVTTFIEFAEARLPLEDAIARTGEVLGKKLRLDVPKSHLRFLRSLEPFWTEGRLVFCHGGVRKEWESFSQALRMEHCWQLMTARGDAEDFLREAERVQVVGHRRRDDVTVRGWICMIDTACVSGNYLSALIIPDGWKSVFDFEIRQVRARRNWRYVYWDPIQHLVPACYVPGQQRRRHERRIRRALRKAKRATD